MRRLSLDALIYGLSAYGLPIAIAALTWMALATWKPYYQVADARPLRLSVLEQSGAPLAPAQALAQLQALDRVLYQDTRLSEAPFWFSFSVQPDVGGRAVELPSRHAVEAECWEGAALEPLGRAARSSASTGRMRAVKAGFALLLAPREVPTTVLCRATYAGPARISALQMGPEELTASIEQFNRGTGLLDGGLIVLALFVLVTGLINRDSMYVLFAVWLVASLRLGAMSAGSDTQWLERTVPPDWVLAMRELTIAAYVILTYALFRRLFRDDLKQVGHAWALRVAQLACVVLVVASVLLPFAHFLPVMWVAVGIGIAMLVFLLARILAVTRSKVAMWYSAALAVVLGAGMYEVLAAALGVKFLIGAVNNVTGALASSLLVALAIAQQMRQERHARVLAQSALRTTYRAIPIGLFTLALDGRFRRVNPALVKMLGVNPSRDGTRRWSEFFEPGAWERLRDAMRADAVREFEVRGAETVGKEARRYFVKVAPTDGGIEGYLLDTTERHKATEQLRFLAHHDALTGVLNRRGLEERIATEVARLPAGSSLPIAYLDLDRFKLINDLFGHVSGDDVLRQVCRRIESALAERHAVGRIGGDEFVLVFAATPLRAAVDVCHGIVEALETRPYQTGEKALQVKGSIGLVEIVAGTAVNDAISVADQACRAAKGGRFDGLVVYERDAPAFHEHEQELRLVRELGAGAAPSGLFLAMQPIMSLREPRAALDFEVLVRMAETGGAVVPGGRIIAAAENNGRVAVIDRWVLTRTLEWLDQQHAGLARTRFVCMNLSGGSLNDVKFVREAFALLADHPRAAQRLCVEITESVALHDLANTRRFIERLRGLGARVALDDFGAGYTSFSYLKELPADALKIDGNFVRGVCAHPANLAIVEAIAELARNLGMQTIAEWAEDLATVEALFNAGIDYVQGYVIARPQSPERILAAESAASFIEDPGVARFVGEALGADRNRERAVPL